MSRVYGELNINTSKNISKKIKPNKFIFHLKKHLFSTNTPFLKTWQVNKHKFSQKAG